MAQFDVYKVRSGDLVLDCQSDLMAEFNSRIVAPLYAPGGPFPTVPRLNPVFVVNGAELVMKTEFLTALPVSELGAKVASLIDQEYPIKAALDVLISGV